LNKQLRNFLAEGWTVIFTAGRMGVFRSDSGSDDLFRKTLYRDITLCLVETIFGRMCRLLLQIEAEWFSEILVTTLGDRKTVWSVTGMKKPQIPL